MANKLQEYLIKKLIIIIIIFIIIIIIIIIIIGHLSNYKDYNEHKYRSHKIIKLRISYHNNTFFITQILYICVWIIQTLCYK